MATIAPIRAQPAVAEAALTADDWSRAKHSYYCCVGPGALCQPGCSTSSWCWACWCAPCVIGSTSGFETRNLCDSSIGKAPDKIPSNHCNGTGVYFCCVLSIVTLILDGAGCGPCAQGCIVANAIQKYKRTHVPEDDNGWWSDFCCACFGCMPCLAYRAHIWPSVAGSATGSSVVAGSAAGQEKLPILAL